MTTTQNQSESSSDLSTVFEKIQEMAAKSTSGDYIYRGEPEHYQEDPTAGKSPQTFGVNSKKRWGRNRLT